MMAFFLNWFIFKLEREEEKNVSKLVESCRLVRSKDVGGKEWDRMRSKF